MTQRSRNFFLTFNNYTDEEEMQFYDALKKDGVKYYVIGREIGKQGTPHLQGTVCYENPRSFNAIKNRFCKKIHWEFVHDLAKSIKYCKKDSEYSTYGEEPKGKGTRTDLINITQEIKDGKSTKDILESYGDKALRITHHINSVRRILREEKRNWVMDVRIYIGPPGCGKSRAVWEEFGVDNVYPKMVGKWWDNYNGETCVLIDDFDPDNCYGIMYDFYLKLLDRYPMMIEWKGGSGQFCSKTIIFTSNYGIDDWFKDKSNKSAFMRRVTEVRHFDTAHDTEVAGGNTITPASNPDLDLSAKIKRSKRTDRIPAIPIIYTPEQLESFKQQIETDRACIAAASRQS